jgi:cyclase
VIPVLLLHKKGLYKSVRFSEYSYVGDPINAVKIFNEKEVDEILLFDIDASRELRGPDFNLIKEVSGEAFIPMGYGGGITNMKEVNELFYLGVEKVVLNTTAFRNLKLVSDAASYVGSQSVVASIDVRKDWLGRSKVYVCNGREKTSYSPEEYAIRLVNAGAGEIILNSIDRDGTYSGYDLALINRVSHSVGVPVVACGGASGIPDFVSAIEAGASAVSAGSMFVFQRPHKAVLISYPSQEQLNKGLYSKF